MLMLASAVAAKVRVSSVSCITDNKRDGYHQPRQFPFPASNFNMTGRDAVVLAKLDVRNLMWYMATDQLGILAGRR